MSDGDEGKGKQTQEGGAARLPGNGAPPPLTRAPLAYENPAFLNSADGRLMRIMSEYLEPLARFRHEQIQDTVVFFGSARFRGREEADHELELLANTGSQQACAQPRAASQHSRHCGGQGDRPAAQARSGRGGDGALLRGCAAAFAAADEVGQQDPLAASSRFVITSGGGPGHYGSRQPRRLGGGRKDHRTEYPAARLSRRPTPTSRHR